MEYGQWAIMEDFRRDFFVQADPEEQDRLPMIPLKGKRGSVYVHGADRLGAVYRCNGIMVKKIRAEFPDVDILEGDGEMLVTWPKSASWCVALLDRLGARRRPRISDAEREARRQRGLMLQKTYG